MLRILVHREPAGEFSLAPPDISLLDSVCGISRIDRGAMFLGIFLQNTRRVLVSGPNCYWLPPKNTLHGGAGPPGSSSLLSDECFGANILGISRLLKWRYGLGDLRLTGTELSYSSLVHVWRPGLHANAKLRLLPEKA